MKLTPENIIKLTKYYPDISPGEAQLYMTQFEEVFSGETNNELLIDQDWGTLSMGFFIARGLSINKARDLSYFMRYETELA